MPYIKYERLKFFVYRKVSIVELRTDWIDAHAKIAACIAPSVLQLRLGVIWCVEGDVYYSD